MKYASIEEWEKRHREARNNLSELAVEYANADGYKTKTEFCTRENAFHAGWKAHNAIIAGHIEAIVGMVRALEYLSCEGMDDGDFYAEEFLAVGTISMANRARNALAAAHRALGIERSEK